MKTSNKNILVLLLLVSPIIMISSELLDSNNKKAIEEEIENYKEWRLRKEKEEIKIYTRWIDTGDEDRKAREMRAVFKIKVDVLKIAEILRQDNNAQAWLERVKKNFNFDEKDANNWYSYSEFKIPWPFENQSIATKNKIHFNDNGKIYKVDFIGNDSLLTENGVKRIYGFNSSWEMIHIDNDTVMVTYTVFSSMKPMMPRWFTDPLVENGLWKSMYNFKKILNEESNNDSYAKNLE